MKRNERIWLLDTNILDMLPALHQKLDFLEDRYLASAIIVRVEI